MTGLDIYLELWAKNNTSIDELNIGNWKKPENKYQGYKEAVSYAVTKDREAREQRDFEERLSFYKSLTSQQRTLINAVATRLDEGNELALQSGPDRHVEGMAKAWVEDLGHEIDPVFEGDENEVPFSALSDDVDPASMVVSSVDGPDGPSGVGDLVRTGTSHDWEQPPHKMLSKRHQLSEIDEQHRLAFCTAHGHRVRINVAMVKNGETFWRCEEKNTNNQQKHRQDQQFVTYNSDAPNEPKCCGNGGACEDCPFR